MAMKPEQVKAAAEATGGKKARRKKLKTQPQDTKEKKLPKDIQKGLEAHFGRTLSKVRVHTGGNAAGICKEVKARAFTIGNNIYFRKPGDAKNGELLVHELAHVLQQGKGRMPKPREGEALTSK